MSLISAKRYENAGFSHLIIKKLGKYESMKLWVSMKNVVDGVGVKNISDLVLKEIYGIYEKKKLTKEEMTNIITHCKGKKKRGIRSIYEFKKQLRIPDHEISVSIEHVVKSKIGKIFVNEDILEEKSVRIYEIDPYFSEHYKKNTS